jgi:hypothetical protein
MYCWHGHHIKKIGCQLMRLDKANRRRHNQETREGVQTPKDPSIIPKP